MKKLGIMQPYFLPYIGYFQLIKAADQFVLYEDVKYTKKGWINRNRFLQFGKGETFTLPLKKDSDFLNIIDRELSSDFKKNKLLNQFQEAYRSAPYFEKVYPRIEKVISNNEHNLFGYIHNSIRNICEYLRIDTEILISSSVQLDPTLRGEQKVISICNSLGADIYINPIGGQSLYSKQEFNARGIELKFLKTKPFEYKQLNNEFVPWLSIADVMMFNSVEKIGEFLMSGYELV